MILTLKTDNPTAVVALMHDGKEITTHSWTAHRQLAETLHQKIDEVLSMAGVELSSLDAIVVYAGPGSFTGLRIGVSVANALGYALNIPVVGGTGDAWHNLDQVPNRLTQTVPMYGAPAAVTVPKK